MIVFIYGCASAAVAPTLERDMENSIIINPLRDEAEAGIMWWNFTRSRRENRRETKRTEGDRDRVGVIWNPIEISHCFESKKPFSRTAIRAEQHRAEAESFPVDIQDEEENKNKKILERLAQ